MAIEFQCVCGRKLTVSDDAAGRKAKCPSCGAVSDVPGVSAPETEEAPQESKVNQVVDQLSSDLAESRERAPQLTQIAVALAVWAGVLLVISFFLSIHSVPAWMLVWLPMSLAGAVMALGIIKADPRTPKFVEFASPVIVGANWAILWLSTAKGMSPGALFILLITLVNVAGFSFLFWYFRRPGMHILFPEKTVVAEIEEEESPPTGETEEK